MRLGLHSLDKQRVSADLAGPFDFLALANDGWEYMVAHRSLTGRTRHPIRGSLAILVARLVEFEGPNARRDYILDTMTVPAECCRPYGASRRFAAMCYTSPMTRWTRRFDMRTVPDEVLFAESSRRMRARQNTPPRAEVLRPCPKCGAPYGARKLRAHIPGCTGTALANLNPNRTIRRIGNLEDQDAENYRYWQSLPIGERLAAVCELTEAAYSVRKVR